MLGGFLAVSKEKDTAWEVEFQVQHKCMIQNQLLLVYDDLYVTY